MKYMETELDKVIKYDSKNMHRSASENKKKFMDNYDFNLEIPSEYI